MTMTAENKDYVKRGRDRRKEAGWRYVAAMLTPEEVAALEAIKLKHGMNARDAIGKALLELGKRSK